ncbi:MAG TPA: LamG-like jellyroll fold domain-containing protein, partial [Polyangiaceae bacterium]
MKQYRALVMSLGLLVASGGCNFRHYEAETFLASSGGNAGSPSAGGGVSTAVGAAGAKFATSAYDGLSGSTLDGGRASMEAGTAGAKFTSSTYGGLAGSSLAGARSSLIAGTAGAPFTTSAYGGLTGSSLAGARGSLVDGTAGAPFTGTAFQCPRDDSPDALCEPAGVSRFDMGPVPMPLAHWTFNPSATSDGWQAEGSILGLVPSLSDPPELIEYPRIDGQGGSVRMRGAKYAEVTNMTWPQAPNGFAVSIWISLEHTTWKKFIDPIDQTFSWQILSNHSVTNSAADCSEFQLDLRRVVQQGDFELVFSCTGIDSAKPYELRYSLGDHPSWTWQTGSWHHIAVTHRTDVRRATNELYWDEKKVASATIPVTSPLSSSLNQTSTLYVGAATNSGAADFTAYLDELAVFDRPLSEHELNSFILNSTTREGPSNVRWRAGETWDDTVNPAHSKTEWSVDDTNASAVSVKIDDQDWGAGVIQAVLPAALPLKRYRNARLEASI